jgi:hypothetical protein
MPRLILDQKYVYLQWFFVIIMKMVKPSFSTKDNKSSQIKYENLYFFFFRFDAE